MKILVTNDDGVYAPGIIALAEALREIGDVTVVAPDREQSAIGHAITLHHPLRAQRLGEKVFAVTGTPTDCVNLGIHNLLRFRPDLVVSGINRGGNMSDDITYSGTVSGAMEATVMGIPAFAVSLATDGAGEHYRSAAAFALKLAQQVADRGLPSDTFLNVNVPDLPHDRLGAPLITSQGKKRYQGAIVNNVDPRGRQYYWIGSIEPEFLDIEGTDYAAVSRGHVSITPLHLDLTNYASMEVLRTWDLG
jgi:5'-nucleotidase